MVKGLGKMRDNPTIVDDILVKMRKIMFEVSLREDPFRDEIIERTSENYDPYGYVSDSEECVFFDKYAVETFDWEYGA